VPLVSRFRPDLGFHPSGEPRPSPARRGALGSPEETNAWKTPRKVPARLMAPTCQRERAVVILIASSSAHCFPCAVKTCRRRCAAMRRGELMCGRLFIVAYRASGCIHPLLPSLFSTKPLEQWRATAPTMARRTMASAGAPCTSGRAVCYTWRDNRRRRTSARPEAGA
jgi:hypothetical protein